MVKKLLIKIIKLYQKIPFNSHYQCRYIPSCSNYAIIVINDFGALKGSILAIKRIIKCNPKSKGGIDLPPQKENKK